MGRGLLLMERKGGWRSAKNLGIPIVSIELIYVNRNLGSLLQRGDPIRRRLFTLVFSLTKAGLNRRSNTLLTLFASPMTTIHKPKSLWRTSVNPEPAEGTKHNFGSTWDPHIPVHPLSIYTIDKLSSVLSLVIDSSSIGPFRLSSRGMSRASRLDTLPCRRGGSRPCNRHNISRKLLPPCVCLPRPRSGPGPAERGRKLHSRTGNFPASFPLKLMSILSTRSFDFKFTSLSSVFLFPLSLSRSSAIFNAAKIATFSDETLFVFVNISSIFSLTYWATS